MFDLQYLHEFFMFVKQVGLLEVARLYRSTTAVTKRSCLRMLLCPVSLMN